MIKQGFFWHCHHDVLVEYCYDYDERVQFIKKNKPKNEQKLRLRLFKPVKGKLPKAVITTGKAYAKAWEAYAKAWEAYDKAWEVYAKAWEACVKAQKVYDKAQEACVKAWEAYDKTLKTNLVAVEKLHTKECPNCSWDGKNIFNTRKG